MKKILFGLIIFISFHGYTQGATKEIKEEISDEFSKWAIKNEFESNSAYEKRIKEKSEEQLQIITNKVVNKIKSVYLMNIDIVLKEYNPDNSIYLCDLQSLNFVSGKRYSQQISFNVSNDLAKYLKENYMNNLHGENIQILPFENEIINDKWEITKAKIVFGGSPVQLNEKNEITVASNWNSELFKIVNLNTIETIEDFQTAKEKANRKSRVTGNTVTVVLFSDWDIKTQPGYISSENKPISFNFEDLKIELPTELTSNKTTKETSTNEPNLDISKIQSKNSSPNAFAVVIGNKEYVNTKKVNFALNDAAEMKNYLVKVLGYKEGNIFYIENANKGTFETYFGTKENPEGKLFNNIKPGISDVFIYYAGHGAPGLKDNKGYFVPVDCDPQYVEQGGYSLDLFYINLAKLNAKSLTVVTDACFSGADIFKNISPIVIKVTNPIGVTENCVILSSSSGSQVSSWFNEKQHGMFTYFFLKSLEDKTKSDKNGDDKLSFQEIYEYVSDKTEGVPYYSRSIHGVDQTPTIQGSGVENVFIEYR